MIQKRGGELLICKIMTLVSINQSEWMGNVTTTAAVLIPREVMSYHG